MSHKIDVKEDFLPFHRPSLSVEEEQEIIETLRSGWITTGPRTKQFEREFAKYTHAKNAIGLNSCTAALHLALVALDIGERDEVITTPITFAATANVICHQKATPVFVDVEPDTLNIDTDRIEEKITPKTKAIIPVHFAGHPCDMDKIIAIASKHNLTVIEDAAHAVESEYKGRKVGSIGDMACFSFYATKNITTGEGGMLTTDSDELAEKIGILGLHGISRDAWKRYSADGYKHWDIIYPGYKYNMFDIQAALGIHQLRKIEQFWAARKRIVDAYNKAFAEIPEVSLLSIRDNVKTAYHLLVAIFKTEQLKKDRDAIISGIQSAGVGIGVHFRAVHLHPYYVDTFGFRRGMFPNAEYASDRVISLPLFPSMTDSEVERVVETVRSVIYA